ncbi:hypothetical protein L3V77_11935 [Vibrio sp. DW001]|uniref:hypothetical protein n=1 Tax=Vibrio sp. DW001 TaxID=2912315 RepID=UPI0023B13DE9|nr:hypothetical protein [Vibrio sp. DW001]WED25761.1 hypothetical protein L3V77_11935 [Vibrio sp. DW001]
MKTRELKENKFITSVIDESLKAEILSCAKKCHIAGNNKYEIGPIQTYLALLVDCLDLSPNSVVGASLLHELNTEKGLAKLFKSLTGMIICEDQNSNARIRELCNKASTLFECWAKQSNVNFEQVKFTTSLDDQYSISSIETYRSLSLNKDKLRVYKGYIIVGQDGGRVSLDLSAIFYSYGGPFTSKVYESWSKVAGSKNSASWRSTRVYILKFWDVIIERYSSLDDVYNALSARNQYYTVQLVYNSILIDAINNDLSIESFHSNWSLAETYFKLVFIDSGMFPMPAVPWFTPKFSSNIIKTRRKKAHRLPIKHDIGISETLITNLPLHISDDEAMAQLLKCVSRDLAHVAESSKIAIQEVDSQYSNCEKLSSQGIIKHECTQPVVNLGPSYPENTCATFSYYSYDSPCKPSEYLNFLRWKGKAGDLAGLICTPLLETLAPFITILMLEHPEITPLWLSEWRYLNSESEIFLEKDGKYIISSINKDVILNKVTKQAVEGIFNITAISRGWLQGKNNPDSIYMVLYCSYPIGKPKKIPTKYIVEIKDSNILNRNESNKLLEKINDTQRRYKNFEIMRKNGAVKHVHVEPKFEIGFSAPENLLATFFHYTFNQKGKRNGDYPAFLGCLNQSEKLTKFLVLPTTKVLYPFLALLVAEHPIITPSWLENWEYRDVKGRNVGFFESDGDWFISSYKNRRGADLSEQTIQLNERSKYVVEVLLRITKLCRNYLEEKGDLQARYMLLSVETVVIEPRRVKRLYANPGMYECKTAESLRGIYNAPQEIDGIDQYSEDIAKSISRNVTLRRIRSTVAVSVYLKTRSLKAMAEALGHKEYRPVLIDSYLPKELQEYFMNRWIRQFQNSIIFECMKESDLLYQAIDVDKLNIEEFLNNHGFGDFPINLLDNGSSENIDCNKSDLVTFTLNVAILQVLILILSVGDELPKEKALTEKAMNWYELAKFILCSISLASSSISRDIKDYYELAKNNPLPKRLLIEELVMLKGDIND